MLVSETGSCTEINMKPKRSSADCNRAKRKDGTEIFLLFLFYTVLLSVKQ